MRRMLGWIAVAFSVVMCTTLVSAWEPGEAVPQWIWHPQHRAGHVPNKSCFFRRKMRLPKAKQATVAIAADDHYELFVNGKRIGEGSSTQGVATFNVTKNFVAGDNMVAVRVDNQDGATAGMVARVVVIDARDQTRVVVSDASWKTSLSSGLFWTRPTFADGRWQAAKQLGPLSNFVALQRATAAKRLAQQKQAVEQKKLALQKQQQLAKQQAQEQLQQEQLARELQQQQEQIAKQIEAQQQQQQQLADQIQTQQQQLAERQRAQAERERQLMLAQQRTQELKQQAEQAKAQALTKTVQPRPTDENPAPERPAPAPQTLNVSQTAPVAPPVAPIAARPIPQRLPTAPPQMAAQIATTGSATTPAPAQPSALTRQPKSAELEVPREFQVQQLAGHADVGSLSAVTFDEQGQLIVGREDGQLWKLTDEDQDGSIDTRQNYGKLTDTCQGLLAHDQALFISGLGPQGMGVYRLTDRDQDGVLDEIQSVVKFSGENQEHGPHGITLGPDGKIYVMVGNHCQVPTTEPWAGPYRHAYEGDLVLPRFEDPGGHANQVKAPGGFVMRMDSDGNHVEVFAGGLRNAYDLAFNSIGELFAHDSDMESDRGTTWYRPTRLYHIIDGAEFGWRSGWAKWPAYYLDSLPSISDTGRGSPTGMVVYNHDAFPEGYRNTIFSADWTNGQVYVITAHASGASYHAETKPFLRGTPLNATDLEVGPDGALYVVTGGRGTSGNIYRISWKGHQSKNDTVANMGIDAALTQPQMHSSWARANVQRVKHAMGSEWGPALQQAVRDVSRPTTERVQALQIMQWLKPAPDVSLLGELANDEHVVVRRMATYLLGLHERSTAAVVLLEKLGDQDAIVRRRACEALVRGDQDVDPARLSSALTSTDRFESWAARLALESEPLNQWLEPLLTTEDQRLFLEGSVAALRAAPSPELAQRLVSRTIKLMEGFLNDKNFVDLLRVQQLALIRGKLNGDQVPDLREWLPDEYPSSSEQINRELIRLLVFLQADSIADRYVGQLGEERGVEESIHLAMHLTFLKSNWNTDQKLKVFEYLTTPPNAGNSLPGYLQSAAHQFGEILSDEELMIALARGPENPGSALAALLRMPAQLNDDQLKALQQLDQDLVEEDGESYRRLKIAIVAILARDGRPVATEYLRTIYDRDPHRRVEVALGMSQTEDSANWSYLIRSLPIMEDDDAKEVLTKLKRIRKWPNDAEAYRQVIMVADRLQEKGAPEAIALLEHWQGYAPSNGEITWQDGITAWKKWYQSTYPDDPMPTMVVSTQRGKWDSVALLKHLDRSEREDVGSPARGMQVFVKARCVDCHQVSNYGESMGPDLTGISKRFLKREVLDAVLYPSKVISDQYAAKIVATTDGKTYTGIVADGSDGEVVILQANGQKVRVPQNQIDEIEPSRISAMPEGLIDDLSLEEITDLFAFLLSDPGRIADLRDDAETR